MGDLNKQGNTQHPDLPCCIRCGADRFQNCEAIYGNGVTLQYTCTQCKSQLVYQYRKAPGILIWVELPDHDESWTKVNAFIAEVQRFRNGLVTTLPPVPTFLKAHVLENRQWRQLS